MADSTQIIELYSELAVNPQKDFGWEKGLENAKAHGYKEEWFEKLPSDVWEYCAAVGNPFSIGEIPEGATVLDLGCGAGVDLLISAILVGESGKVTGVDITPKMVEKAKEHVKRAGFNNVNVLESSFDTIAIEDESVDIVISNGAINLTSCKESVFAEIYRVLKPDGKIYFADMIDISVDEGACCSVEKSSCCDNENEDDWANCVAGTLHQDELIELMEKAGFENVSCTGLTHYTTAETTQGATFKATKIPAAKLREKHWDNIFKTVDYTQVLWHQKTPGHSLALIEKYAGQSDAIIDAGCGASFLVDALLENGYQNITLLDTSKTCLNIVHKRVDAQGTQVKYICSDILNFTSDHLFNLWHDRAVFHFLLQKKQREQYFQIVKNSLPENGFAVISTFAMDGDSKCAGLDVIPYDEETMRKELPKGLKIIETFAFIHTTPKKSEQKYISFVIEKKSTQ